MLSRPPPARWPARPAVGSRRWTRSQGGSRRLGGPSSRLPWCARPPGLLWAAESGSRNSYSLALLGAAIVAALMLW